MVKSHVAIEDLLWNLSKDLGSAHSVMLKVKNQNCIHKIQLQLHGN